MIVYTVGHLKVMGSANTRRVEKVFSGTAKNCLTEGKKLSDGKKNLMW